MSIFTSTTPPLPIVPEDKTVAQFILDCERPVAKDQANLPDFPCLIEEQTGRQVFLDEVWHFRSSKWLLFNDV